MSKNLKIFLGISYLILLFAFLYFIFSGIDISKLNDFSYYKEIQSNLDNYISKNIIVNLFYFFILQLFGFHFGFWITNINYFWNIIWPMVRNFNISNFYLFWSFNLIFHRGFFSGFSKNVRKKFKKYISYFKKTNFITFLYIDLLGVWEFHLACKI